MKETLVLLITKETDKNFTIYDVMKEFHDYMNKNIQGILSLESAMRVIILTNASKHYEEATIALRLAVKKKIVAFQSLGIVGVLINSKNMSGIKMIAEEELGPLYNMKDPKAIELLKTLYIYLLNGGKLEQTMSDLVFIDEWIPA